MAKSIYNLKKPEERARLYMDAHNYLQIRPHFRYGLCAVFDEIVGNEETGAYTVDNWMEVLPEFSLFYIGKVYFWDPGDIEHRLIGASLMADIALNPLYYPKSIEYSELML